MSLDTWLIRSNPRIQPPSFKRVRLELWGTPKTPVNATPLIEHMEGLTPSLRRDATKRDICKRPVPRNLVPRTYDLYSNPPEYAYGLESLQGWNASKLYQRDVCTYSVECVPQATLAAIGQELGRIDLVSCSSDKPGALVRSLEIDSTWPVQDMAAVAPQTLVCAHDTGLKTVDLESGQVVCSFDVISEGITKVQACGTDVVAVGSRAGAVGLVDLRDADWRKMIKDAHAISSGPRAQRVTPAISALNIDEGKFMLISGTQHNETVKFWDIRKKKTPLMATIPRSRSQQNGGKSTVNSRHGGINSLVTASSDLGGVWALARSGELLRVSADSEFPECRLRARSTKVVSPFEQIELIPQSNISLSVGHESPIHPLLAVGGSGGVTLISEPSMEGCIKNINATQASQLRSPNANIVGVKWHPYCQELVTVSSGSCWQLWARNDTQNRLRMKEDAYFHARPTITKMFSEE